MSCLRYLILISLAFCLSSAFGQYDYVYDSLYLTETGQKGQAKFTYQIDSKGKHIKEGAFEFNSKKVDSSYGTSVTNMSWEGHFHYDLKEGDWEYITIDNNLKLKDISNEYEVKYELYSEKERLKAQYINGKPNGKWRLEREVLKDGNPVKMIRAIRGNMKSSKFNGSIEIFGTDDNDHPYTIEAEAEAGLLIEECVMEYHDNGRKVREVRYYDRGFLIQLIKTDRSTGATIVDLKYPLSSKIVGYLEERNQEKAANLPLSLDYSDGYPRSSKYIKEQGAANELIRLAFNDMFKFESNYFASNGLPLGTNRLYYPLTSEEKEMITQWANIEFEFRDKITALTELKEANFKYSNNDTLRMIDEWADRQTYLLNYIKPWNQIIAHDEIIFYNREGLLFNYALDLLNSDTILFGDSTTVFEYDTNEIPDSTFLFYIMHNFKNRISTANEMLSNYEGIVEELNLASEIVAQERRMNAIKANLDSLYTQNIEGSKELSQLLTFLNNKYLTSSYKEKHEAFISFKGSRQLHKSMGDSLLFELRTLRDIYYTIEDIKITAESIDTLYTEYIFDAYTFNDRFPKRMKKKLYQAVEVELFRDLIDVAKQQNTPVEVHAVMNQIRRLQDRMVFLVDKDTDKLERKLRDKLPLEKRLELMKID